MSLEVDLTRDQQVVRCCVTCNGDFSQSTAYMSCDHGHVVYHLNCLPPNGDFRCPAPNCNRQLTPQRATQSITIRCPYCQEPLSQDSVLVSCEHRHVLSHRDCTPVLTTLNCQLPDCQSALTQLQLDNTANLPDTGESFGSLIESVSLPGLAPARPIQVARVLSPTAPPQPEAPVTPQPDTPVATQPEPESEFDRQNRLENEERASVQRKQRKRIIRTLIFLVLLTLPFSGYVFMHKRNFNKSIQHCYIEYKLAESDDDRRDAAARFARVFRDYRQLSNEFICEHLTNFTTAESKKARCLVRSARSPFVKQAASLTPKERIKYRRMLNLQKDLRRIRGGPLLGVDLLMTDWSLRQPPLNEVRSRLKALNEEQTTELLRILREQTDLNRSFTSFDRYQLAFFNKILLQLRHLPNDYKRRKKLHNEIVTSTRKLDQYRRSTSNLSVLMGPRPISAPVTRLLLDNYQSYSRRKDPNYANLIGLIRTWEYFSLSRGELKPGANEFFREILQSPNSAYFVFDHVNDHHELWRIVCAKPWFRKRFGKQLKSILVDRINSINMRYNQHIAGRYLTVLFAVDPEYTSVWISRQPLHVQQNFWSSVRYQLTEQNCLLIASKLLQPLKTDPSIFELEDEKERMFRAIVRQNQIDAHKEIKTDWCNKPKSDAIAMIAYALLQRDSMLNWMLISKILTSRSDIKAIRLPTTYASVFAAVIMTELENSKTSAAPSLPSIAAALAKIEFHEDREIEHILTRNKKLAFTLIQGLAKHKNSKIAVTKIIKALQLLTDDEFFSVIAKLKDNNVLSTYQIEHWQNIDGLSPETLQAFIPLKTHFGLYPSHSELRASGPFKTYGKRLPVSFSAAMRCIVDVDYYKTLRRTNLYEWNNNKDHEFWFRNEFHIDSALIWALAKHAGMHDQIKKEYYLETDLQAINASIVPDYIRSQKPSKIHSLWTPHLDQIITVLNTRNQLDQRLGSLPWLISQVKSKFDHVFTKAVMTCKPERHYKALLAFATNLPSGYSKKSIYIFTLSRCKNKLSDAIQTAQKLGINASTDKEFQFAVQSTFQTILASPYFKPSILKDLINMKVHSIYLTYQSSARLERLPEKNLIELLKPNSLKLFTDTSLLRQLLGRLTNHRSASVSIAARSALQQLNKPVTKKIGR